MQCPICKSNDCQVITVKHFTHKSRIHLQMACRNCPAHWTVIYSPLATINVCVSASKLALDRIKDGPADITVGVCEAVDRYEKEH